MNKKVGITIISIIVVILVCACLVIVVINQNKKTEEKVTENKAQELDNTDTNQDNTTEIKEENIVLNSKVGLAIQDSIYIPNIYSNYFFKEIGASGLDDRAKIMFTFAKMVTDDTYSNMLRQSEDYTGMYITKEDLQSVANKLFEKATNLKHQEVFLPNSYDKEKGNYIQLPTGFVEFSYVKDLPYKIEQIGDEIKVHTYRMYIDCNSTNATDENVNATQVIYYDEGLKNKAITVNDESMDDESKQSDYLNTLISSGKLNKEKFEEGVYTLIKKGNSYLIKDIK